MTKGSDSYRKQQEEKSGQCPPLQQSDKDSNKAKSGQNCGCSSISSKFQNKQDNKCEKKEEPIKKSSCANVRQESSKGSSGGKGGAGECVCGPKEESSLKKKDCSGEKSVKEKCGPSSEKGKPKCHSSQEEFKKQQKEKQKQSCESTDKDKNKCHSSYAEFTKSITDDSGSSCSSSSKKEYECHDSQKEFFKNKGQIENIDRPHALSFEEKNLPCSTSKASKSKEQDCSSAYIKLKEGSTCSKISNYCRNLAKEYVKPKSSSKCSSIENKLKKDTGICSKKPDNLPANQPPCKPIAEVGTEVRSKSQCVCTSTCPKAPPPNLTEFFPLDVRNKELNECIEKYMKVDPGQIISKCSKFANVLPTSMQTTCPSLADKQQRCLPVMKTTDHRGKMTTLLSPKTRQLMGRWATSACFYLTTTALVGLYVTEWKPILRYVPMYSSYIREQELLQKD